VTLFGLSTREYLRRPIVDIIDAFLQFYTWGKPCVIGCGGCFPLPSLPESVRYNPLVRLCCTISYILQIIGWAGRFVFSLSLSVLPGLTITCSLWSSRSPLNLTPYLIQYVISSYLVLEPEYGLMVFQNHNYVRIEVTKLGCLELICGRSAGSLRLRSLRPPTLSFSATSSAALGRTIAGLARGCVSLSLDIVLASAYIGRQTSSCSAPSYGRFFMSTEPCAESSCRTSSR
jgi:hypothetical protein